MSDDMNMPADGIDDEKIADLGAGAGMDAGAGTAQGAEADPGSDNAA